MDTKVCSKCKSAKTLSEFAKGRNKDGYHSYCKICSRACTNDKKEMLIAFRTLKRDIKRVAGKEN